MASFSFHPDGSRIYAAGEALSELEMPVYTALGLHATLYDKFKHGDWLPNAVLRLEDFDDPRLRFHPDKLVFLEDCLKCISVSSTYNHYEHGRRCVLGDAEAPIESRKRKEKDYTVSEQLMTREDMIRYAASGTVPDSGKLTAAPLFPEPMTVVVDLSKDEQAPSRNIREMMNNLYGAHRKHRLYVKQVRVSSAKHHLALKTKTTGRNAFALFKEFGDDPGGARGCVEMELREKFMLEDNSIMLSRCSFNIKKEAYLANRDAILEHRRKTYPVQQALQGDWKALMEGGEKWNAKFKWALDFQIAQGGISLNPPKTSASKRAKASKKKASGATAEAAANQIRKKIYYDKSRKGAAKASEENLQIPQIEWCPNAGIDGAAPCASNVLIISAETFEHYVESNVHYSDFCCSERTIILGKVKESVLNEVNISPFKKNFRVVSHPEEIEHLFLLIQWLPLWWDTKKHTVPKLAGHQFPRMRARLKQILEKTPGPPSTNEYGELEPDVRSPWMIHLAEGAKHMPLYALAQGLQDE